MRCEAVEIGARATPREIACQGCGCTESAACPGGCYWVSLEPPICSACQETAQDLDGETGFFGGQHCPASAVPALHALIWVDGNRGYCARCREGFVT